MSKSFLKTLTVLTFISFTNTHVFASFDRCRIQCEKCVCEIQDLVVTVSDFICDDEIGGL